MKLFKRNRMVKKNKYKLKKKWRFWREFKKSFLRRKKKQMFYQFKWFFNQKRIVWHQVVSLYGNAAKNSTYKKSQTRLLFGSRFVSLISFMELRLVILIMRMQMVKSVLEAKKLIECKLVQVNGVFKSKNYLVKVGDIIRKTRPLFKLSASKRESVLKWPSYKWRRWCWESKKKGQYPPNVYWYVKKSMYLNFLEINLKIPAGILLRSPLVGEILLANKKRMFSSKILKKIYYLY